MAPIDTESRKRSTPTSSDDDAHFDEHKSKRLCTEPVFPQAPLLEITPKVGSAKVALFDDDPRQLFQRSVALALAQVGFDAASPKALEALCAEAEIYAMTFLSEIRLSMLNARRPSPTPIDFEYALQKFSLPTASLEPHLKPPIPKSRFQIQLDLLPAENPVPTSIALLLGYDLSGEPDKQAKPYIPKRFPSFPSRHTYKWTEKEPDRERDARKLREKGAIESRHAEDNLRRLTNAGKLGKDRQVREIAEKDPESRKRHELWEETMQQFTIGRQIATGTNKLSDEAERSMIVNANKPYHRKGATTKRTPSLDIFGS